MISTRVRDSILVLLIPATFLVVTPWNNLDGTNPAKFLALVSLGMTSFALTLSSTFSKLKKKALSFFQTASLGAIALILISLFVNRYSTDERLFGVYGRSLGAITFLSLFAITFAASVFDTGRIRIVNFALLFSLAVIATYFIVQIVGWDPASWEDAYGGIPSSTLGNPNFLSSGLAILSTPLLAYLYYRTGFGLLLQICVIPAISVVVFLIWKTKSSQGLAIVLFSLLGLLLIRLNDSFSNRHGKLIKFLTFCSVIFPPVGVLLIAIGVAPQFGGSTLLARYDYWRAALNLILSNPLFGRGFDSFGDWYFYYRDENAALRSPDLFTDSTHNLILELGAFGGLPLMITYLVLQALALRNAMKIVTLTGNVQGKVLVVTWIGFHLQSSISPSSLALITLGMALTGIVYKIGNDGSDGAAYAVNARKPNNQQARHSFAMDLTIKALAIVISGSGFYLGAIPIVKDARFRDAIERGNGQQMIEISSNWPLNYQFGFITSNVLKKNGYDEQALNVLRDLISQNPANIQGWRNLYEISNSPEEKFHALKKMKELDPLNVELAKLKS